MINVRFSPRNSLEQDSDQSPNLSNEEGYSKAQAHGKQRSNGCPFAAAGFFVDGVNGGAARVVDEAKEHEINGR